MVTFFGLLAAFLCFAFVGGGPFVVAGRLGGVGGIEVFSDFFAKYTVCKAQTSRKFKYPFFFSICSLFRRRERITVSWKLSHGLTPPALSCMSCSQIRTPTPQTGALRYQQSTQFDQPLRLIPFRSPSASPSRKD
jgi:hypothetical protein